MFVARIAAAALALAAIALPAAADWKPTKPVDFVVHTGPGGGSDVLARAVATMFDKEKLVPVRMNVLNKDYTAKNVRLIFADANVTENLEEIRKLKDRPTNPLDVPTYRDVDNVMADKLDAHANELERS